MYLVKVIREYCQFIVSLCHINTLPIEKKGKWPAN